MSKTRADLEAAIWADRDDEEPYRLLSDLLQHEGDPRGALIALDLKLEELHKAREQLLNEHTEPLLGKFAPYTGELDRRAETTPPDEPDVYLTWLYGFVDTAYITTRGVPGQDAYLPKLIEQVVDHPSCQYLRGITVSTDGEFTDLTRGAFFELIRDRLPNRLESLNLSCWTFGPTVIAEVCKTDWPRLATLWIAGTADRAAQVALFENIERFPKLTHLEFGYGRGGDAACELLANSNLTEQLEKLELPGMHVTDEGAQHLHNARERFPKLNFLNLVDNNIGPALVDALSDLCERVWLQEQTPGDA